MKNTYKARRLQATRKQMQGLTLIEIMIVVVIIAVLAAMIVGNVMGRPDEARIAAARQDISTIMGQLKMYKLDNRTYPSTEQGLAALVKPSTIAPVPPAFHAGGYLPKVPADPWGNPYQYLSPGVHGDIDVWSLGADGKTGGEGADADIGSWM